ncbi:CsbD family protein [Nannocystis bainbridge]|uniref:CsbD family protein n=1 Tax=Nannocystis bainbridge TaxID=2995303 RepID=A0ABT5EAB5_9BACT|nr:CsbD family protein [Nannocystis bainbridge]MDC0722802.1 CsbD family protein [Nannocystis bainbridge]
MNRDQLEGKWEQLKGKAKELWGNLTDDDFLKAEGKRDKLCGIIQERSGERREDIERKLQDHNL